MIQEWKTKSTIWNKHANQFREPFRTWSILFQWRGRGDKENEHQTDQRRSAKKNTAKEDRIKLIFVHWKKLKRRTFTTLKLMFIEHTLAGHQEITIKNHERWNIVRAHSTVHAYAYVYTCTDICSIWIHRSIIWMGLLSYNLYMLLLHILHKVKLLELCHRIIQSIILNYMEWRTT